MRRCIRRKSDTGLRQVHHIRGMGKAARLCHRLEDSQLTQINHNP